MPYKHIRVLSFKERSDRAIWWPRACWLFFTEVYWLTSHLKCHGSSAYRLGFNLARLHWCIGCSKALTHRWIWGYEELPYGR